ncbi:hypothetical protein MUO14_16730 [Halobacillus shinanisalinarum]|uniref:Uncharacterized protein n=1 Tax=Halobacillus shinanisalinarum TaxID=2932258 RepID=A0ABY4GVC8_9BACI|nr:hypothetical protein [Halobacillus shinanisalinarum]UOQ92127.1 hypothetical protein MUO14_16730 [Halobacillus shinanisalinarum]
MQFNAIGNIIAAAIAISIGTAIWNGTWVSIILPLLLFGPELLMDLTDFQESTRVVVSSVLMFAGVACIKKRIILGKRPFRGCLLTYNY